MVRGARSCACLVAFFAASSKLASMLRKFQSLVDRLGSHASLSPLLAGSGIMTVLAGWAAHATAILRPYAPLSWVAVSIITLLLCASFYALIARAWLWHSRASSNKEFYRNVDRINPLETTFQNRRILVSDLVSPIEPIVRGKTFIDCEIIGPANIVFTATYAGSGGINGCGLHACEGCTIADNAKIINAIIFIDCNILRGKLYRIMLFYPKSSEAHMKASLPSEFPSLTGW